MSLRTDPLFGPVPLRPLAAVLAICLLAGTCGAQQASPVITVPGRADGPEQAAKHYVVLVSLVGFRYDYAKRYGAKNLLAIAAAGTSAPEGMIPSYPSVTFANHYTLVTGLYPGHHGIVGNVFYDPLRRQVYSYRDESAVTDGTWYGGTPLWVLAEQQGMLAASFFWPGSEADIQGVRPSYYMKYDQKYPNDKRVEQVLAWLRLPAEKRPHFLTLYFSDVDSAGHSHGPDSEQVRAAVAEVDREIGKLAAGVAELKLPVDLVVLADHGMEKVEGDWIDLNQYFDKSLIVTPVEDLLYPKNEGDAAKIYDALNGKSEKFKVYRAGKVPAELHYDGNPRLGDPVVVPAGPYLIRVSAPGAATGMAMKVYGPPVGMHGYDPAKMASMKAIFFAAGPDIRAGATVKPFENVDVYPLVARILGLDIGAVKIDGSIVPVEGIFAGEKRK